MRRNQHSSDLRRAMIHLKVCLLVACVGVLTSCNMTDGLNSPWIPTETPATTASEAPAQPIPSTPVPNAQNMIPATPQKVALLLPLSGRGADTGQAMLNAAQLAMFDLQASTYFELLPIDTNSGAAPAIKQAVDNQASLVLGPLFADNAKAIAPVAVQYGVNVVSFSTDTSAATGSTFLMGFTPQGQIEQIIDYAASKGMHRIALAAPRNAYGDAAANTFVSHIQRRGLANGGIARYPSGQKPSNDDLWPIASSSAPAIGRMGIDAVLIAAPSAEAAVVSDVLSNGHGMPSNLVKRLGTGLWDTPETNALPALRGAWYAASSPRLRERFEQRYAETYGTKPPRLASLAYDGAALAVVLAKSGKGYSRAALTNPSGFFGIDGVFRFGNDGIAQRGLAILEVSPTGARVIQDAPSRF